ncbi:MAG: fibro-slime domain-containing protein [Phycisphaerales bacterium]
MTHQTRNNPRSIAAPLAAVFLFIATPATAATPPTIELTGVVRDFIAYGEPGGHPAMERGPKPAGLGPRWVTGNLVDPIIGSDRKPVFTNNGILVKTPWRDSAGRNIAPQLPVAAGDVPGELTNAFNEFLDPASFLELFNDVPGVNLSAPLTLTFNLQADGSYLFDADNDPDYSGGFFPINNQLFGNYTASRNYHFSFELHTQFIYDAAGGQLLDFSGDDDVWVFIDDRLVIDLGGRHSEKTMYVDLDRLGLTDGMAYRLDFFLMERQTSGSHCKFSTNLPLEPVGEISISNAFD